MDVFLVSSGAIASVLCAVIVGFDHWSMRRLSDMERAERQALSKLMEG